MSDLSEILNGRLVPLVKDPNPIGNLIFVENPDTNSSIINLIWDIQLSTNVEAILFQRTFITLLANIYYSFVNVSCQVTDDSIFIDIPDDTGLIIKPTTQISFSKIHVFSNHYKGQISLDLKFINKEDIANFLESIERNFKSLITEISLSSLNL